MRSRSAEFRPSGTLRCSSERSGDDLGQARDAGEEPEAAGGDRRLESLGGLGEAEDAADDAAHERRDAEPEEAHRRGEDQGRGRARRHGDEGDDRDGAQQVDQRCRIEDVVDGYHLDIRASIEDAEYRAPDATVVLDDDFVSTHHTRLSPRGTQWIVEDLNSTNGTWIDKDRVIAPTVLQPGMQLRIGRTHLELGHE